MGNFPILFVICAVVGCVYAVGDEGFPPQPKPPSLNTTVAPLTTSEAPNTTIPTPVTKPTTQPTKPTTQPTKPTTQPTTTPVPTSPTTPAPTPTPGDPDVGNWNVSYKADNRTCITLQIAAQYEIISPQLNSTVKLNIPKNAAAAGKCEDDTYQNLTLSWDSDSNSVEFLFKKTNESKYEILQINSVLSIGKVVYLLAHHKSEFSAPLRNSYKCAHEQTLNLTNNVNTTDVYYLHVSHLQYQAYRNTTEHNFDSALDCDGSVTPDIVPIVVGCVLAALVVMVLVAYLVGRRRCQARGYLSIKRPRFQSNRSEEQAC